MTGEEPVDVASRLHPYEQLFNEAMAMAARFAEDRTRRDTAVVRAAATARTYRRRAS